MDAITVLTILILLQIKHLIVDWCWQPPYEWQNKGTYGHWGGIRHALKNALGTGLCFMPFFPMVVVMAVVFIDLLVHYHLDWSKMRMNARMGWHPTSHPQFWMLTGLDQALHQITYLALLYLAITW